MLQYKKQSLKNDLHIYSKDFIQGAAIDRILGEIVHHSHVEAPIDYVLCVGHFLPKVSFSYRLSIFLIIIAALVD